MPDPFVPATTPAERPSTLAATIVYIAYLATFVTGFGWLVGLVIAYVNRGSGPLWLDTHYRYQIRTFWMGLAYTVLGFLLVFVVVGWLVWLAAAVWLIMRCAKGLSWLSRSEPVPDPLTWGI